MISLAALHSFALPYHAQQRHCFADLASLRQAASQRGLFREPHTIVAGGTNTVFSCDYEGAIICPQWQDFSVTEDPDYFYVRVGAGYSWHQLVCRCLALGMLGLENLALIPGSVGAAPIQNIGAYGVEFADCCQYVEFIDKHSLETVRLTTAELDLAYRSSVFKTTLKDQVLVSHVGLRLAKRWQPVLTYQGLATQDNVNVAGLTPAALTALAQGIFDRVVGLRQTKLPDHTQLPNAGSFFKNPLVTTHHAEQLRQQDDQIPLFTAALGQVKLSAAWLIEQCGYKGYKQGQIGIYAHHALVLVNYGQGTGAQLLALVAEIISAVEQRFGVQLTPEVKIMGKFGELCF